MTSPRDKCLDLAFELVGHNGNAEFIAGGIFSRILAQNLRKPHALPKACGLKKIFELTVIHERRPWVRHRERHEGCRLWKMMHKGNSVKTEVWGREKQERMSRTANGRVNV